MKWHGQMEIRKMFYQVIFEFDLSFPVRRQTRVFIKMRTGYLNKTV